MLSILFWISPIHAVYEYKFVIILRFSNNQVYARNDYTLYSNKPVLFLAFVHFILRDIPLWSRQDMNETDGLQM